MDCAIPGVCPLIATPAIYGSAMWDRINMKRSTIFPRTCRWRKFWLEYHGSQLWLRRHFRERECPAAAEYSHDFGLSVTGGYVYRGSMPEWNGVYLYGDYCTGTVWGLILSNGQWQSQVMFETVSLITSFGVDEAGELYLVSDNGSAYILARK